MEVSPTRALHPLHHGLKLILTGHGSLLGQLESLAILFSTEGAGARLCNYPPLPPRHLTSTENSLLSEGPPGRLH